MASLVKHLDKLRERSDEVETKDTDSFNRLTTVVKELKDILADSRHLVALSGPQIKENIRVFCIRFSNDEIKTFVNPLITYRKGVHLSREVQIGVDRKEYIVPRSDEIDVTYQTATGLIQSNKFTGLSAEVFQQMVELLDGVLISDYGLEVIPEFDSATDDEKAELISYYLDTLKLKYDVISKEVGKDAFASRMDKVINVLTKIRTGEIEVTPIEENGKED